MIGFYNTYGLTILFWVAVICIVGLLVYNLISGATGTYVDHSNFIWSLLSAPGPGTKTVTRNESSGEVECRRVAEKLTGFPFPKHRPVFLRNVVTDSNLELDCYCKELAVAIEYNGRQHYEYTPYFHSSRDAFNTTRYRDEMKARLCKDNGISLIVVPYSVPVSKIEAHLSQEFERLGIVKNRVPSSLLVPSS
jgi:hypothetical protein